MSTELGKIDDLQLTRFYGGAKRGLSFQFTRRDPHNPAAGVQYVQISAAELLELIPILQTQIAGTEPSTIKFIPEEF